MNEQLITEWLTRLERKIDLTRESVNRTESKMNQHVAHENYRILKVKEKVNKWQ